MDKRIDEIAQELLHRLIDTRENTNSLFQHQLSELNDADSIYYIDFLTEQFEEYGINKMIESYYRDAFEDIRIIREPDFPVQEDSKEGVYNRNDRFLTLKTQQLKEIEGELPVLSKKLLKPKQKRNSTDIYSYNWIHQSGVKGIRKFHKALMQVTPEIISHQTQYVVFKKAFTNIKLTKDDALKIAWCVNGPNTDISKQSLYYFMGELERKKLIDFSTHGCIPYIFIDSNGQEIKNISVSDSQGTGKPTRKADIDAFIQKLLKDLNPNT